MVNKRTVVISGLGVITPSGIGKTAFWDAIVNGVSKISRVKTFDPSVFRSQIAGQVVDFNPGDFMEQQQVRRMDRFAQFAVAAAKLALDDAGLVPELLKDENVGVIIGTAVSGFGFAEKEHDKFRSKVLFWQQRYSQRQHRVRYPLVIPFTALRILCRLAALRGLWLSVMRLR